LSEDATLVDISSIMALADFTQDYEFIEILSLSDLVAPPDLSLEEDDFEDVEGVLSSE